MGHHGKPGIVGRMVMMIVKRGEQEAEEPCEVVACQTAGEYGYWRLLVATSDGALLETGPKGLRLIADQDGFGPFR